MYVCLNSVLVSFYWNSLVIQYRLSWMIGTDKNVLSRSQ